MSMRRIASVIIISAALLSVSISCDVVGTLLPPDTPTNIAIYQVSENAVQLAWIRSSTNERTFDVEMKSDPDGQFIAAGSGGNGDTRFTVTGLAADTKYYFRLRASNSAGFSSYTSTVNVTTLGSGASTITPEVLITSPVDGATVTSPFDLYFLVTDWRREATHDTHLHPFYDDVNQGAVFDLTPLSVDLAPGVHVITLKLANPDHSFIGVEDTIEVVVQ